ncbi:MAG: hypothetical protein LBF78_13245, partial [Treponema sp.]|nr:hypothetical protein [Treponema sp.]
MTGSPVLLKSPFFTLEYDPENACLRRSIPPDAEDLGDGIFKWGGLLFSLGEGPGDPPENKFLKSETIRGKEILAIARRGYNPLIKSAPVMAEREDRLMEMTLLDGPPLREDLNPVDKIKPGTRPYGKTEIRIMLRRLLPKGEDGFPLEGLPNFRFCKNRIYELIPQEIIDELFAGDNAGGFSPLVLKNAEIPGFADDHARLIYVFADKMLYDYLCQDNLFISPKEVSLVLRCAPIMERCAGKAAALPALKYGDALFSAQALSRRFRSLYLAIRDKWIRRESLELIGIGPLGRYINGESLAGFRITGREVVLRKSERKNSLFRSLEWDRDRWIASGSEDEIFKGHLDFLRAWGCGGGVIRNDREKAAQSLAGYLHSLWEEIEEAEKHSETEELFDARVRSKILVLLPASFWNHWLCKELPQSGDGPLTVPPGRYAGADSVWDPAFRGIGLAFYRDLPAFKKKAPWDILITAGLEEALDMDESVGEDLLENLLSIPARIRLGIFFSASGVFYSPYSEKLKKFFRIKGKQKEIEKYLIRECGDFIT